MSKNAMPVSKAKTAYGLLSEIRKLILEEPKRYNQTDWLRTGKVTKMIYRDGAPACGTVGCVAGWVIALKANPKKVDMYELPTIAGRILGIKGDYDYGGQVRELFHSDAAGVREDISTHAERGAEHIAKFQKKYAKQLKAKKV